MELLSRFVTRDRSRLGGLTGGHGQAEPSDWLPIPSVAKQSRGPLSMITASPCKTKKREPYGECIRRKFLWGRNIAVLRSEPTNLVERENCDR